MFLMSCVCGALRVPLLSDATPSKPTRCFRLCDLQVVEQPIISKPKPAVSKQLKQQKALKQEQAKPHRTSSTPAPSIWAAVSQNATVSPDKKKTESPVPSAENRLEAEKSVRRKPAKKLVKKRKKKPVIKKVHFFSLFFFFFFVVVVVVVVVAVDARWFHPELTLPSDGEKHVLSEGNRRVGGTVALINREGQAIPLALTARVPSLPCSLCLVGGSPQTSWRTGV